MHTSYEEGEVPSESSVEEHGALPPNFLSSNWYGSQLYS